ncbi:hypothetical protein FWC31_00245 [Candidatus Saccharibacteria bacterium]|nr:hypothetical protein [Candidatus Saccharibacteria bacterium]
MKAKNETGKIVPNGVRIEKHEYETVLFLTEQGFDVELIPPKNSRSADLIMDGITWEMKCPRGSGERTIEKLFQKALHQSVNLIFDLRKIALHGEKARKQTVRQFELRRSVKRLIIITKTGKILDMKR